MGRSRKKWSTFTSYPKDACSSYGLCGDYGNCIIGESPSCQCLDRFKPKSDTWNIYDWSMGCVSLTT